MSQLARFEQPLRRVLVVDAGSRCLKLALVERCLGRLRILREQALDLQAEGLVSADEITAHLHTTIAEWGRPPVALTLPQHLSTSQLIDLPAAPESEIRRLITEETKRLSGVSESAIIYDFVQVAAAAPNRQQYWVSLCQEGDIREQIRRLGLEAEDICEVTTPANGLLAAFRASAPGTPNAVLVQVGAQSTVVVLLLAGQGVFASNYPVGGDFFTRAVAHQRHCGVEPAEDYKRTHNLFHGPHALPEFPAVVDGWLAELIRHLQEWFEAHPGVTLNLKSFDFVVCGGVFSQPGLPAYLNERSGLKFKAWLELAATGTLAPATGFEAAFGTALQALGRSAQPTSLLPPDRRAAWHRRLARQLIECASTALLGALFLVLAIGTWQQARLASRKEALLAKVETALEQVQAKDTLTDALLAGYDELRPLLERQQQTINTLKTLALLEQTRSNRTFWYVLLADQQSYFTLPLPVADTNAPAASGAGLRHGPAALTNFATGAAAALTNAPAARPAFIAELCIPEEAEAARRTLSQLVADLKLDPLYARVDSLPDDLRRNLADPKALLPDHHFALALELADAQWQRPALPRRAFSPGGTNGAARASSRPPRFGAENPEATSYLP